VIGNLRVYLPMPVARIGRDCLGDRRLYRGEFVALWLDAAKRGSISGLDAHIVAFEQQPADILVAPVLVQNRVTHFAVEFFVNQKLHDSEQKDRDRHADIVRFEPDTQLDRVVEYQREGFLLIDGAELLSVEDFEML
jgi:hypothetical protein